MKCFNERSLDRAALRLADAGFPPGIDPEWFDSPALPGGLRPVLAHAAGCLRCRELLELFHETEVRAREAVAARVEAGAPGARIIPLEPLRARSRRGGAAFDPGSIDRVPFPLAADAPGSGGEDARAIEGITVLTLGSPDGRILVRIFPDESGRGATAILLRDETPDVGDAPQAGRSGSEAGGAIVLRIGDADYPFDKDGIALLPAFPSCPLRLVIR